MSNVVWMCITASVPEYYYLFACIYIFTIAFIHLFETLYLLYTHFTYTFTFIHLLIHPILPPTRTLIHIHLYTPQIGMLKCIIAMYENSARALSESTPDKKVTWSYLKTTLAHVIEKVKATKFEVSLYYISVYCYIHAILYMCYIVIYMLHNMPMNTCVSAT